MTVQESLLLMLSYKVKQPTFLFVHSDNHDTLVASDADEFVDGADATTRELAQQDHSLDVVVLQQADVSAHLGDGAHVHHHHILHLRETVLVKPTAESRHHCNNTSFNLAPQSNNYIYSISI